MTVASNAEALIEVFGKPPEDLHEDLVPYLETEGQWPMIRHPLVFSIMHADAYNGFVNQQYLQKLKAIDVAWGDGDWHSYVWLHERPYRIDALVEAGPQMDDDTWWSMVAGVWIDSENIRQQQDVWDAILRSDDRGASGEMMTDEDHDALMAMPDTFTVWQGCTTDRTDGWSWTTQEATAIWFGNRFANLEKGTARVRKAIVRRNDVIAYFSGRNEAEILVDPDDVEELL